MKSFFKKIAMSFAALTVLALAACGGSSEAQAASPAYQSDAILVTWSSQGITGWAAIITDIGTATANINDTTPTVVAYVTAFSPDYNSTAKVYNVSLFLTQGGAAAYLTAHPGTTVGWYAPATRN